MSANVQTGVTFDYGTAGFRTRAERLDAVAFRSGALAAARSAACGGAATGLVITARRCVASRRARRR